jgi:tetratricopeptide (TPR) repeat protein
MWPEARVQKKINSNYMSAGIVALATFLVYTVSLHNKFIEWDDPYYILSNPHIRSLNGAFIKWAFFDFYIANWHPLTWFSHAVDYALWGLNPVGHHLSNVLLHAANTFLVVYCVRQLLETAKLLSTVPGAYGLLSHNTITMTASLTGLLFGLHPIHVESVAWVSERKDLLCAFFFLLSIMSYLHFAGRPRIASERSGWKAVFKKEYLLSLAFFILALLSKPMAVTLPVVLLILDWSPLERLTSLKTGLTRIAEKTLFFLLSIASSALTIFAQREGGAIKSVEFAPMSVRLLVAAKALVAYLGKMLVPVDLVPFYPYPKHASLFSLRYGTAVVLVTGITAICVVLARKQKHWLGIWAYYIVTLAPVLGFVLVGKQSMADRYTYLPSLGPFLALGLLVTSTYNRLSQNRRIETVLRYVARVTIVLIMVAMISLTIRQIGIWNNSIVFWTHVLRYVPDASFAYKNRGIAYAELKENEKAMADYNQSISLDNTDHKAYTVRGVLYDLLGEHSKAMDDFNRAIALKQNFSEAYYRRALVFDEMGRIDDAANDLDKALMINSSSPTVLASRAFISIKRQQYNEAIGYLTQAIMLDPGDCDLYLNRGGAYAMMNNNEMALLDMTNAIRLNSRLALAYFNRGSIHERMGSIDPARADYQKACVLGFEQACVAVNKK